MATFLRHWLGTKKYQFENTVRALAYRTQTPLGLQAVSSFWEEQAVIIHEQWGEETHDFAALAELFAEFGPSSILDVGCGSGRLFGHYIEHGINDIIGLDISEKALTIAHARYPSIPTLAIKVEELDFPVDRFDLAICNRVLQHIPRNAIAGAVSKLCSISKAVYVNELTESDQLNEEFFMFRHDYPTLFAEHHFQLIKTGLIGTDKSGVGNSHQQTFYYYCLQ